MPKRNWLALAGALLLLFGLLAGALYFADNGAGDSFPDMSSLNAGPKGAKLLYDGLASIQALAVSRNFQPLSRWRPAATTILFLGVTPDDLNAADASLIEQFEKLSQPNNRLVVCVTDYAPTAKTNAKNPSAIQARWGLRFLKSGLERDSTWQPVSGVGDTWQKTFGAQGTVVVALHSNELSNEILGGDNSMEAVLPPLLGANTSIVFEETHFGLEESGSIAGLARRYRLQGLIAGLLLLAVLFIWNRSVSFPPPSDFERARQTQLSGADAQAVFAGLIARHLTPPALIEACVAEWNRLRPRQRVVVEISNKFDPVAAYRHIQEGLRPKRSRT